MHKVKLPPRISYIKERKGQLLTPKWIACIYVMKFALYKNLQGRLIFAYSEVIDATKGFIHKEKKKTPEKTFHAHR